MSDTGRQRNLLTEFGQRGVYKAVAVYVAVAWGSTEILITVSERLGLPDWTADAALILFLTGLPFVVLLSWAFDLTGEGLHRVEPGSLRGKVLIATGTMLLLSSTAYLLLKSEPFKVPELPVIAALPFQDFSGVEGANLIALAFTDELIHRISAHPDLMALDLRTVTNPMLATMMPIDAPSRLHADYIVQGSLHAARNALRIRIQMTDSAGAVIWAEEFVRDLVGDALAAIEVQSLIAGEVAARLGRTLTGVDYCAPSADSEAVRLYYEAWRLFGQRSSRTVAEAALALEAAIERDPDYARALSLLGQVYLRFPFWMDIDHSAYEPDPERFSTFMDDLDSTIGALARRAINRCPGLGSAYYLAETSQPVEFTLTDTTEILLEALSRDPENADLLHMAVHNHATVGHLATAVELATRAYRKDPLNPRMPHELAKRLKIIGRFERGIELRLEAQALGYNPRSIELGLALLYLRTGDSEALDALLPAEFEPTAVIPIDPRRVLAARGDEGLRAAIIGELKTNLPELNGRDTFRQLKLALLMDDEDLVWQHLEHYGPDDSAGVGGFIAMQMYDVAWRHKYLNRRLLDLMGWYDDFSEFWDRFGPPDGCDWDGETISCSALDI